ncbi:MAG: hypothetical protein H6718_21435 [Polyangiaceae bacterium]|nr:hypothetical protein [Myxococcales bacterium]MCB9587983.1 hypothetical protein [Polyangiaceae bacterium]
MTPDALVFSRGVIQHGIAGSNAIWNGFWIEVRLNAEVVPEDWLDVAEFQSVRGLSFGLGSPFPRFSGPASLNGRVFEFDGDASASGEEDEYFYLFAAHNPVHWQRFRFVDVQDERLVCDVKLYFDFEYALGLGGFWWEQRCELSIEDAGNLEEEYPDTAFPCED